MEQEIRKLRKTPLSLPSANPALQSCLTNKACFIEVLAMELLPVIWTVVGIALILLEFVVSGFVIIFFGISAVLVGLAIFLGLPQENGIPYVLFSVLCLLQVFVLRKFVKKVFTGDVLAADGVLNDMEEYIGHEAVVQSGFSESPFTGRVEFKGAGWDAKASTPLSIGQRVKIIARQGIHFHVEP